ncbi:MAG: hypothetical protein Q8R30_03860 [bacterium]|nr:hypothetical protein [bacterium]MDZ4286083.1 hypothetical protein [Candidatus Sungbacteria bacterium]
MSEEVVVGVPREIMSHEGRVPIFPATIQRLRKMFGDSRNPHFVVERGVGALLGVIEQDWKQVGADVCEKSEVYGRANIVLKVKQPFPEEVGSYHSGQVSACFHHMATNKDVVKVLVAKGVLIAPFEYYRPSLGAMSMEAGKQVTTILNRLCGDGWKQEHIFLGGGRGIVCQHAIRDFRIAEVPLRRIHACDREAGAFFSTRTMMTYKTFSSDDDEQLCVHLQQCRILILAAVGRGGAPRFITPRHLELLPDNAIIIQVSIDEGGNIDDLEFQRVTYWGDPSYQVERGGKRFTVCNVPDIPGCLAPLRASIALVQVNLPYYVKLIRAFPEVPSEFLYKPAE